MIILTYDQIYKDIFLSTIADGLSEYADNLISTVLVTGVWQIPNSNTFLKNCGLITMAYFLIEAGRSIGGNVAACISAVVGGGLQYYYSEKGIKYAPIGSANYLFYELISQYHTYKNSDETVGEYIFVEALDSILFCLIDEEYTISAPLKSMFSGVANWYIQPQENESMDINNEEYIACNSLELNWLNFSTNITITPDGLYPIC